MSLEGQGNRVSWIQIVGPGIGCAYEKTTIIQGAVYHIGRQTRCICKYDAEGVVDSIIMEDGEIREETKPYAADTAQRQNLAAQTFIEWHRGNDLPVAVVIGAKIVVDTFLQRIRHLPEGNGAAETQHGTKDQCNIKFLAMLD